MSSKRIEQLIEDIYEYMESCKPTMFNGSKITVQKDVMYDFLDELRLKVPEEIKRCQKMIANRDAIIADAESKAIEIENEAKEHAKKMVNESEIMQQAYYQANEMIQSATEQAQDMIDQASAEATQIRQASLGYTNDMLADLENMLSSSYEVIRNRADAMLEAMQQNLETVVANRMELNGEDQPAQLGEPVEEEAPEQEENLDDYNFDENTFLPNPEEEQ